MTKSEEEVGPSRPGAATAPSLIDVEAELVALDLDDISEEQEATKAIQGRNPWRLALERLRKDRAAVFSAVVIVLVILMAIFAPLFAHFTGHAVNQQFRTTGENAFGLPTAPGTNGFSLGADDLGRDVLVRIAYGAQMSLLIGVVVTLLTVAIGAVLGMMAGYLGRAVDTIIARLIDITLAIPFLLFAIVLASRFEGSWLGTFFYGVPIVVIVLAGFGWSSVARIVRGQVLSIREREYVEAARSLGSGPWRIMIVDILPNVMAQVIVYASLLIPATITAEATLSFLGVGIQPPRADWGAMISEATNNGVYQSAWWLLVFPSIALIITTLAFNILGDGVRDAFDPRSDRLFN